MEIHNGFNTQTGLNAMSETTFLHKFGKPSTLNNVEGTMSLPCPRLVCKYFRYNIDAKYGNPTVKGIYNITSKYL